MFQLSPPVLYDLGLEPAVEELAIWLQRKNKIAIDVDWSEQPLPLSIELRIILFQSVRELLMNVIQHSQATRAEVSIWKKGDQLEITVEDNGVGFNSQTDPNQFRSGVGLLQIRERLRNIGGDFKIESGQGRGTRALIRVPLGR